jgi:hypothetical protein
MSDTAKLILTLAIALPLTNVITWIWWDHVSFKRGYRLGRYHERRGVPWA